MALAVFHLILAYTSLRGHSTAWRNSQDTVLKQVVYDKNTRNKPRIPGELDALRALPNGFAYKLYEIPTRRSSRLLAKKVPLESYIWLVTADGDEA